MEICSSFVFKYHIWYNINVEKNYIKNDYFLMAAAVLLLVLSGFLVSRFSIRSILPQAQAPQIIGKAVLTIDFGNGEKRAFEGNIIENEILVGVLTQASKAGNFSYKLDQKNNLAAIEEFIADGKKSWHWYLNGKKINKPLSEIIIKDGDDILIKYE